MSHSNMKSDVRSKLKYEQAVSRNIQSAQKKGKHRDLPLSDLKRMLGIRAKDDTQPLKQFNPQ